MNVGVRIARPPRRVENRLLAALPDFDIVFVAGAMLTALFPLQLGSFTGVLFIAMPALYCCFRQDRVWPLLQRTWLIMLLPGLAILSTLWSPVPAWTAYYSTEFAITVVVAAMVGAGTTLHRALIGLFAAFAFHCLVVYRLGVSEGSLIGLSGYGSPFIGFAGSKNTTADMAALGIMTSLALIGWTIQHRRYALLCAAVIVSLMELQILVSAQSAGASASLLISSSFLIGWLLLRNLPVRGRVGFTFAIGVAAIGAILSRSLWYNALFESALKAAGKDDQLTGRTFLWSRAEVLIHQRPVLGRGFGSFWQIGHLEPEAIWEAMFVRNRTGFNFHNSIYEILVYFGYAGAVVFAFVMSICAIMLFSKLIVRPHPTTILFSTLLVYDLIRFNFESLPLGIFAHNTVFLYGALAHGFVLLRVAPTQRHFRLGENPPRPSGRHGLAI